VPIVLPVGGHAVYIDARALLPHIPPLQYPAWALNNALYLRRRRARLRDRHGDVRPAARRQRAPAAMELVRLAFPRRVYTQSHMWTIWRR
jgi:tryptophanase